MTPQRAIEILETWLVAFGKDGEDHCKMTFEASPLDVGEAMDMAIEALRKLEEA